MDRKTDENLLFARAILIIATVGAFVGGLYIGLVVIR